jgi:hypothetical protein
MYKSKRKLSAETLGLPPLRMVLGEVPSPNPERRHPARFRSSISGPNYDMEVVVRRLIVHLKEKFDK